MNTGHKPETSDKQQPAFFPFGSMYVPVARATEVPVSEWEKDVAKMKEMGFTIVRSWAAWDRMELTEGSRDFSKTDRLFDLCDRYGLKVTLFIGGAFNSLMGCYAPIWLRGKCQEQIIPEGEAAMAPKICFDDPAYREKAENFLVELIHRYASRRSLHSWIVWGEPAWRGCQCHHTLRKFHSWLEKKYCNLDALNAAWSTERPVCYPSWESIEPCTIGYVPRIDWQEFCEVNLNDAIAWIGRIAKNHSDKPTITYPCPWDLDARAPDNKSNFWLQGRSVDILGMSHYLHQYPDSGRKGYIPACYLDRVRSAAKNHHYWVMENQAGPILWNFNDSYQVSPQRNIMIQAQMLAHGAKGILSWLFRTRVTDMQAGEFGLLGWDGSMTDRAEAVAEFAHFIKKNSDLIMAASYQSEVAILSGRTTLRLSKVESCSDEKGTSYWQDAWMGAYKLLWDLNLQADFLDDPDIIEGKVSNYKVLLVPFRLNLSRDIVTALARFVHEGGRIIADFPFGMKTDQGFLNMVSPPDPLPQVFGYNCVDMSAAMDREMAVEGAGTIPVHRFQQQLTALDKATVTGRFSSGKPAVIINTHGAGKTMMAGSMLFAQYHRDSDVTIRDLVRTWLDECGVSPRCNISLSNATEQTANDIEMTELVLPEDNENLALLFILNHNREQVSLNCALTGIRSQETTQVRELYHGMAINLQGSTGSKTFELVLDGMSFAVVLLIR